MKSCPVCSTEFPAGVRTCPEHGVMLLERLELAPGQMFRELKIVRVLGRGGMGVVYLAEHALLKQPRALKFLGAETAMQNPQAVQRFLREAQRAAELGLHNANIVKTLDMGQDEKFGFFIGMEFVDGPNLAKVLEQHPQGLPVERALRIVRGIANGLEAAHAKGMVHRDIKPLNILMGKDGTGEEIAKIADFGIVTGGEEDSRLTRTGVQPLTPHYASPEQWRGVIQGHQLDGRTDLYALGCMFFEMLTGSVPFHGETQEELREQHLHAAPPAPSLLRPELRQWPGLDAVVLRMMVKAREHRQGSVREFLAELDAAMAGARGGYAGDTRREGSGTRVDGRADSRGKDRSAGAGGSEASWFRRWPEAVPWALAGIGLAVLAWGSWKMHDAVFGGLAGALVSVPWLGAWLVLRRAKAEGGAGGKRVGSILASGLIGLAMLAVTIHQFVAGIGWSDYMSYSENISGYLKWPVWLAVYGFLAAGYGVWLAMRRFGYGQFRPSGRLFCAKAAGVYSAWVCAAFASEHLLNKIPIPDWVGDFGIVKSLEVLTLWAWFSTAAAMWLLSRSLGKVGDTRVSPAEAVVRRRGKIALWVVLALIVCGFIGQAIYRVWKIGDLREQFDAARSRCESGELAGCKDQRDLDSTLKYTYHAGGTMSEAETDRVQFQTYRLSCEQGHMDECDWAGDALMKGKGVPKNYDEAIASYSKSCSGGYLMGCSNAAHFYQRGHPGMDPDAAKTAEFYLKGCGLGDKDSCLPSGYHWTLCTAQSTDAFCKQE